MSESSGSGDTKNSGKKREGIGSSQSTIAVSKLAVSDLQEPHSALSASLHEASEALERFITQPIDEIWDSGLVAVALEWLKTVIDLSDVVEAASSRAAPRGSTGGWPAQTWGGGGRSEWAQLPEGLLLEIGRAKRQAKAYKITLATFADLGRVRPESLGFQDWCDVRRDAFDLCWVLDQLRALLDGDRR